VDLFPSQREAVQFLGYDGGILAYGPGTGKTATALTWLRERQEPDETALIVCPKVQVGHWRQQAEVWYPECDLIPMVGTAKHRAQARDRAGRLSGSQEGPAALLTTYESMRQDYEALVKPMFGGLFVFDEAHRLKNRAAQVTKAAKKLTRNASAVAHLTGTPIMNAAEELWSLLNILDPKRYSSFWRWVNYYFDVEQTTFNYRLPRPVTVIHGVKPHRLAELREEIREYLLYRTLRDLVDLPPLLHAMIPVVLSPKERKAYDQMEKHSWMEVEGQIVQAENEVARNVRLRQLASEWGAFEAEGLGTKATATVEVVRDLVAQGEQVVVLAAYKATVEAVATNLMGSKDLKVGTYTGDISQKHRDILRQEFIDGDLNVLVGTLATMGEGIDGLQVARHLVMVDRDWTPARNDQAIGRLLRRGQDRPVVVHHVYAEGTIDEDVAQSCARKTETIESVMP